MSLPLLPSAASLGPLFRPASVAVIGASADPGKIAGRSLRYLKDKFAGPVFAVNSRAAQVQGLPAVPSISQVPAPVDLAVVVVPATGVVQAVEECALKGVKAVVIFSSGFAEVDAAGRQEQTRLTAIARASGMRIVGPNCMGVFDARNGLFATFTTSFDHGWPKAGRLGVVSQSGAFGAHCFVHAREKGLGFSLWATTGNECDVEFADCLEYMAHDESTDVVLGYLEGCRDKDRLVHALEVISSLKKPLVMLKVGRSDVGARAAASHTASLVGSDAVYDALFRQYGVHRASTIAELMDIGYACTARRYPSRGKLGLVSISGGVGVLMADSAAAAGLEVPPMPEAAQAKLKEKLPFAAVRNPVDITAQVLNDLSLIGFNLQVMLQEGGCDSVVLFLSTVGMNPVMMGKLTGTLAELRGRFPDPLIIMSSMMRAELVRPLEDAGYLVFDDPSRAIDVVAALVGYGRYFARQGQRQTPPALPGPAPAIPAQAPSEHEAKRILAQAGIPIVPEHLAATPAEAQAAAHALGYPVVLKVASPDIAHKSEMGGVLLGLTTPQQVATGFEELLRRARGAHPAARVEGVLVAPLVQNGVETILGVQRDPIFGPVVMFGLGGIFVEVLKDVTFRIAPFGVDEAHAMIREVQGFPLLRGARGRPLADVDALARVLAQLSVFAAARAHEIETLDINPLLVLPEGQGCLAVDALIVPRSAEPA